jgi:hypothetical protein
MFLEVYLSRQDMVPYYECGDFPFNFGFVGFRDGVSATDVEYSIKDMLDYLPVKKTSNWVVRAVENHNRK